MPAIAVLSLMACSGIFPSSLYAPFRRNFVAIGTSHERHSEPQAKNPTTAAPSKCEILRLPPQDDMRLRLPRGALLFMRSQLEKISFISFSSSSKFSAHA